MKLKADVECTVIASIFLTVPFHTTLVCVLSVVFESPITVGEFILIAGDILVCICSIVFTVILKCRSCCKKKHVLRCAKTWTACEVLYIFFLVINAVDCLKPGVYEGRPPPTDEPMGAKVMHWVCYWADMAVVFACCHSLCTLWSFIHAVERTHDDEDIFQGEFAEPGPTRKSVVGTENASTVSISRSRHNVQGEGTDDVIPKSMMLRETASQRDRRKRHHRKKGAHPSESRAHSGKSRAGKSRHGDHHDKSKRATPKESRAAPKEATLHKTPTTVTGDEKLKAEKRAEEKRKLEKAEEKRKAEKRAAVEEKRKAEKKSEKKPEDKEKRKEKKEKKPEEKEKRKEKKEKKPEEKEKRKSEKKGTERKKSEHKTHKTHHKKRPKEGDGGKKPEKRRKE